MFDFLALITGGVYWKLHSLVIGWILRLYGIRVGRRLHVRGVPRLKIRGRAENIIIGDDVTILGTIDLRNRENVVIRFCDRVTIDHDCRFVSARDGVIEVGEDAVVTAYAIINGGGSVRIGKKCVIGPRCSINANEHVFRRDVPIRDAGFVHADVILGDDCWLAANVVLMKGVHLGEGTVVGAGAVVTKDTDPYGIYVGIPARKMGERE